MLILLDITPDQSMLDEGVAREIINRIQKLRKKAGLIPSDEIQVYYQITPKNCDLDRVASTHKDFIENTIKAQILHFENLNKSFPIIINESQTVLNILFISSINKMINNRFIFILVEKCKFRIDFNKSSRFIKLK